MKKTALPLLLMAFLMVSTALFAQVVTPVKWKFSTDKVTVKNGDKVTVSFKATIDDGWHLYSNRIPENGPVPTSFTFNETKGVKKLGSIKTNKTPKSVYDESFAMNLEYFESGVTFSQQFEITDATNASIKGVVEFMTCDDQRCLPPSEEDFAFSYKPSAEVVAVQPEKISTPLPTTDTVKETIVAVANSDTEKPVQPKADEIKSAKDKTPRSLGGFFWVAFLSGLAAIFTPCVFPMIPMTVSYFIKGSKSIVKGRINALFYGGSIIGIYTLVGTFFAVTFGANFANFLSTHWIPNVLFFVVFMVFAASFFGVV